MTAEIWWGHVSAVSRNDDADRSKGGHIVISDHRWPDLPAIGATVEVRLVYRSPYWSLVEDDP